MKKMSLTTKLIGGYIIVACITVIVGIIGWRGISATGSALMEVGNVRMPSLYGLGIINEAQTAIQRFERTLLLPEIYNNKENTDAIINRLAEAWQRVDKGLKIYEPLPQTKEEAALWNKFTPAWETWKKDQQQLVDSIKTGKREEAVALSFGRERESFKIAEDLLGEIIELQNRESANFIKESIGDVDRPKIIMGTVMGVGVLAAVLLGTVLSLSITRTLNRITRGMSEGADQVASASGQVSSSSQSLAEGASQQAASIEETSSSMEEMSSMTKRNAENAGNADSLMKEAHQVVITANSSMQELTKSMGDISKAGEQMSKIIKTIDEIAFQTNLLALNAAVEAARAGEAGAGFAVVADEVRNLAMRAATAAKDTAQLIEETVKKVNTGSQLVSSTNEAFVKVAESAGKVGMIVAEIAQASREQSTGIDQVNTAIAEMDKVVQQNAANAEESASAAEEMSAQAEQLKEYVEELVMTVTGKTSDLGRGKEFHTASHSRKAPASAKSSKPGISQKTKKALLAHKTNEIRPEQVIPFNEDENFQDF